MEKNKLPHRHGKDFKVPEGYFETLEDRIMEAVAASEEKQILQEKRKSGFTVPENYFKDFEHRLFDKVEEKKKAPKLISLLNKEIFYYVSGAAAVLIAVFSTVMNNPAQPLEFEDLDMITLEGYLHETLESDVSRYLSEEEAYASPAENPDVDFETVYDYLNENVDEPAILVNEN